MNTGAWGLLPNRLPNTQETAREQERRSPSAPAPRVTQQIPSQGESVG